VSRARGENQHRRLNLIGTRSRERAVLTLRCARTILLSAHLVARFGAAATFTVLIASAAHADGIAVGGCIRTHFSINCVTRWGSYGDPYIRLVKPQDEAEKELAADRDRKWKARCRPIVYQDRYGVPRYEYAAPGCEYGVIE
jgi:hypothetical protein